MVNLEGQKVVVTGGSRGLGLLPGDVARLSGKARVPHVGWNRVVATERGAPLFGNGAGYSRDHHFDITLRQVAVEPHRSRGHDVEHTGRDVGLLGDESTDARRVPRCVRIGLEYHRVSGRQRGRGGRRDRARLASIDIHSASA